MAGYELTLLDANKDGLTDLLLATTASASLFVNTGASFQQIDVPGLAFVNSTTTRVVPADLAGSGDTELALAKGGVAYSLALVVADTGLLKTADDGRATSCVSATDEARRRPGAAIGRRCSLR